MPVRKDPVRELTTQTSDDRPRTRRDASSLRGFPLLASGIFAHAFIRATATTGVNTGAETQLAFDVTDWDTTADEAGADADFSMADLSNNRLICRIPGVYRVQASCKFVASTGANEGDYAFIILKRNGTQFAVGPAVPWVIDATLATTLQVAADIRLEDGDLITAHVLQDTGFTKTVANGEGQPFLTMKWGAMFQGVAGAAPTPHNLLDGSEHPDTVAAAVAAGAILYGNATPKWDRLLIGAANAFLASNGSAPAYRLLVDADIPAAIARDSELHAETHAPQSHTGTDITGAELEDLSDGGATTLHSHAGAGSSSIGDADADTTFETERAADDDVARVKAEGVDVMDWAKSATGDNLATARVLAMLAFPVTTVLTLSAGGEFTATQAHHTLAANGGTEDDCEGAAVALPNGSWLRLAADGVDKITLKHVGSGVAKFFLRDGKDVVLDAATVDNMFFITVGAVLVEVARNIADEGISKIFQFPAHDEDLAVGVMGARPGTNTGESGEHGDYTAIRATAFAGTVGSGAGATTILIEADTTPAFDDSPVTLFTLTLTGVTEHADTVLDNAWVAADIFVRARCTAIEAVAPKDVNVELLVKERLFNG